MTEQPQVIPAHQQEEKAYRDFFKNREGCIITLGDLFDAVEQDETVSEKVKEVLSKAEPITILVEGSAFEQNFDVIDKAIAERANEDDVVILADISSNATAEHKKHLQANFPTKKYRVVQADMNHIPLPNASVDIVINDCAVNFNTTEQDNEQTVREAQRLLKPSKAIGLFSAAVNSDFDSTQFSSNQELTPADRIKEKGFFYPLPNKSFQDRVGLCLTIKNFSAIMDLHGQNSILKKGKLFSHLKQKFPIEDIYFRLLQSVHSLKNLHWYFVKIETILV